MWKRKKRNELEQVKELVGEDRRSAENGMGRLLVVADEQHSVCVCVCVGGGWGVLVSDGNGDGGRCLEWEFGIG